MLFDIKDHNPEEEICKIACQQDGTVIQFINNPNDEICLTACQNNGFAIQYIKKPSYQMCITACQQNGMALQYIDKDLPEFNLKKHVVKNGTVIDYIDNYCFKRELLYKLYETAIKNNPFAIKFIKFDNQSKNEYYDLALKACQIEGLALQFVENQDFEICKVAVDQFEYAIEHVNITEGYFDLCKIALQKDWKTVNLIDNFRIFIFGNDYIKELIDTIRKHDDVIPDYMNQQWFIYYSMCP